MSSGSRDLHVGKVALPSISLLHAPNAVLAKHGLLCYIEQSINRGFVVKARAANHLLFSHKAVYRVPLMRPLLPFILSVFSTLSRGQNFAYPSSATMCNDYPF